MTSMGGRKLFLSRGQRHASDFPTSLHLQNHLLKITVVELILACYLFLLLLDPLWNYCMWYCADRTETNGTAVEVFFRLPSNRLAGPHSSIRLGPTELVSFPTLFIAVAARPRMLISTSLVPYLRHKYFTSCQALIWHVPSHPYWLPVFFLQVSE